MDKKQFLLGMLQIIDVATKRGTWNGEELETVAILRKDVVEQLKEFADQEITTDLEEDTDKPLKEE
jgi:hypothetical protein